MQALTHIHAVIPESCVVGKHLHPLLLNRVPIDSAGWDEVRHRPGEGDAPRQQLQVALDPLGQAAVCDPQRISAAVCDLLAQLEIRLLAPFLWDKKCLGMGHMGLAVVARSSGRERVPVCMFALPYMYTDAAARHISMSAAQINLVQQEGAWYCLPGCCEGQNVTQFDVSDAECPNVHLDALCCQTSISNTHRCSLINPEVVLLEE